MERISDRSDSEKGPNVHRNEQQNHVERIPDESKERNVKKFIAMNNIANRGGFPMDLKREMCEYSIRMMKKAFEKYFPTVLSRESFKILAVMKMDSMGREIPVIEIERNAGMIC